MVLKKFIYRAAMEKHRDIENRFMDMGRWGGKGEMYGKSNMETYITIM